MKISRLCYGALLLIAFVSNGRAQFRADSCGCPIPEGDTGGTFDGRKIPDVADVEQRRSPDGRKLLYRDPSQGWILDLATHQSKLIKIYPTHPKEVVYGTSGFVWCPYDSNVVALTALSLIDTGSGRTDVRFSNLYYYNVRTDQATRITPTLMGRNGYEGSLTVLAWSKDSSPGADTLTIDGISRAPVYGLYIPQTQEIKITNGPSPSITVLSTTPDSTHAVWVYSNPITHRPTPPYYFDHQALDFGVSIDSISTVSFTANGNWVAYWVFPMGWGIPYDTIFDQVWICSTDKPSTIRYVINFQKLYCTYSFWGIYPEFSSDTTLVVSMHKDGDTVSALYEIAFDGRIVRQLTYGPNLSVKNNSEPSRPLTVLPNPANGLVWIRGGSREAMSIYDVAGYEVRSLPNYDCEAKIDCASLPTGTYYVRSASSAAKFQIVR